MMLSFKMKGVVISDNFLMLWFKKDTVGFRYALKKKKRYYLGNFPNMGGGSSQIPKLL